MSANSARRTPEAPSDFVTVYGHSDLLYWWVVWAYGLFCSVVTRFWGVPYNISAEKEVLFYQRPWLGISFIFVLLYVIIFANVKIQGMWSWFTAALLAIIMFSVSYATGWQWLLSRFPLLFVHMNLAFYLMFSLLLLAVWLIVIFGVDRLIFWRFVPGQLIEKHMGGADQAYDTRGMYVGKMADDVFRHKVLGLQFLGLGAGDLIIRTAGANQREIVIHNVWRIGKRIKQIDGLVARAGGRVGD